jgi:hypothetical protein
MSKKPLSKGKHDVNLKVSLLTSLSLLIITMSIELII